LHALQEHAHGSRLVAFAATPRNGGTNTKDTMYQDSRKHQTLYQEENKFLQKKWWDEYKGYHVPGFEKTPDFVPRGKQIFAEWRERISHPFAKTHVYNVQDKAKEYLEACAQEERRKRAEEDERMEWAQVTGTQNTPRSILKRPGSTIIDADVISVYPNIQLPPQSSSPKRRKMETFHNPNVFIMGHNTAPIS